MDRIIAYRADRNNAPAGWVYTKGNKHLKITTNDYKRFIVLEVIDDIDRLGMVISKQTVCETDLHTATMLIHTIDAHEANMFMLDVYAERGIRK